MDWTGQRAARVQRLVNDVCCSKDKYEYAQEDLEEYEDDLDPPNDVMRARLEAFQRAETARYVISFTHIHDDSFTNSSAEDRCKINNLRETKPCSVKT